MTIVVRNISKSFPAKDDAMTIKVLNGVDLDVPDGQIVALFGPNGSGKTTLLNVISRIESSDSGHVDVRANTNDRPLLGYALQNFRDALLPWKTALDNVAFGLMALGVPHATARQQTNAFLEEYGFKFPRMSYPYQLSGGQQQTVVLARSFIQRPFNLLLDEPFGALDHEARFRIQDLVISLLQKAPCALLLVSHDIDEALYMSDELVLLSHRPGHVVERFPVPFQRPRSHVLLASPEFSSLRRQVVAAFLKEVGV